jgi:TetR/AcrR family transcriptional regulator, cholesterol catabolism regulator
MARRNSNLDRYREERRQQTAERRESILVAAQDLFLTKGLEKTSMQDIAGATRISRVTLYRYFPDLYRIAFEVHIRILEELIAACLSGISEDAEGLETIRTALLNMIHRYDELEDIYRFIGMFDHLYARESPSADMSMWFADRISRLYVGQFTEVMGSAYPQEMYEKSVTIGNTIASFMQKMAARGELLGEDQEVPMRIQIEHFEEIITHYIDTVLLGAA